MSVISCRVNESVDLRNNDPQHRVYTEDMLLHMSLSGRSATVALFSPQQLNQLHVTTENTQVSSAAPEGDLLLPFKKQLTAAEIKRKTSSQIFLCCSEFTTICDV